MKRIALVVLASLVASSAFAQSDGGPDPQKVRVRLGPLWMNPTVSLSNLGVDHNVFNEETNPKKDFTLTVTPRTDLWLRTGSGWLRGAMNEDIVWYQKYSSERSANNSYSVTWTMPLSRLSVNAMASRLNTRERANPEIDERAPRNETNYQANVGYKFLSATTVGVVVSRQHIEFNDSAQFLSVKLKDELTRNVTSKGVSVSHQLTPLTGIAVEAALEEVHFALSPDRDNRSTKLGTRVSFDPFALLKGSASFGFRDFKPASPEVPGYRGTTANAELSYTAFGSTKLAGKLSRDIEFSFDARQPYFLESGFTLEMMQQLFGPVDVALRYGATQMAYRDRAGFTVAAQDRVDHFRSYGIGFGYHLGQDIRVAVNFDQQKRTSAARDRSFEGLKVGTAVTVGF
jgi:hypothetical protein